MLNKKVIAGVTISTVTPDTRTKKNKGTLSNVKL